MRRNPPRVIYSEIISQLCPSEEGMFTTADDTAECSPELLNDAVSDTTEDDSSNLLVT